MLKKIGVVFLIVALIVNMPPLRYFTDFGINYQYVTKKGVTFWEMSKFGPTFNDVKNNFADYRQLPVSGTDTVLYRTFTKNPLLFWRWYDYLFHPRYQLPYIDPAQVPELSKEFDKRYEVSLDSLLRVQGRRVTY